MNTISDKEFGRMCDIYDRHAAGGRLTKEERKLLRRFNELGDQVMPVYTKLLPTLPEELRRIIVTSPNVSWDVLTKEQKAAWLKFVYLGKNHLEPKASTKTKTRKEK